MYMFAPSVCPLWVWDVEVVPPAGVGSNPPVCGYNQQLKWEYPSAASQIDLDDAR
jgi:hypothetical protein